MSHWDRVQSMQLELAQKDAHIRRLTVELAAARESRDLARNVAVRLEQENHALGGAVCAVCAQVLVPVPVIGDAL